MEQATLQLEQAEQSSSTLHPALQWDMDLHFD